MMTLPDIELLQSDALRTAIEANIDRSPIDIALDRHTPHARLVAEQVKALQRSARKLPTYYAARALMTARSYEQSSSEATAARRTLAGDTLLDLTFGLGVDSVTLSRRFRRIVAIERDEALAAIARENLRRMHIENIEIICTSAEEYLDHCTEQFDWCLCDPDRRDAKGERKVRLEECSPNVVALRDKIFEHARQLCIKCSPLFDVGEAERLFGDSFVESVSVAGECKEVNIYIGDNRRGVAAEICGEEPIGCSMERWHKLTFATPPQTFDHIARYRYLTLPDAALQHSRTVALLQDMGAAVWSNEGVALSAEPLPKSVGRCAEILSICEFSPRQLRPQLKGSRMNIYQRAFPMSNVDIARKLGVKEGGTANWCFTKIGEFYIAAELHFL